MKLRTWVWVVSASVAALGVHAAADETALATRARETLWQAFKIEKDWVRVHAAEGLIAAGEGERVRPLFTDELTTWEKTPARIGAYRVLATLARTPEERAHYVALIEKVLLDPASPDRPQAVETLGKLACVVKGAALEAVRESAAHAAKPDTLMPLWVLVNAREKGARERLVAALSDPDATVRQRAAYALRWLRLDDEEVRGALARAAASEQAGMFSQPYVLSAAWRTWPDAPAAPQWREALERVLVEGEAGARFEAAQALMPAYRREDLAKVTPLLAGADGDTRIAGAWLILHVLARHEP